MTHLTMQSLLNTLQLRPYVVAFLIAFLIICTLNRGLARTLLFLVIGYSVAFLSEFCSIRWGFPYGLYHYLYENLAGEMLLAGVPVWDSISYVFMAYASWEAAGWLRRGGSGRAPATRAAGEHGSGRNPRQDPSAATAALLMTLLDLIVDPLAVRGDQWFLGKIFYYPEGGIYFGVPLSNFAGWFVVGLLIFSLYNWAERFLPSHQFTESPRCRIPGPLFYLGIALFNLIITFWIGEWRLAIAGTSILATSFLLKRVLRRGVN